MAEKTNPVEEAVENLDAFEDLEKNFHKVVQDLVTDRSLDKFRTEYEVLHKSLVQSHEYNVILIEKCRSLNNDILANANKVSSILQLSQNDQRTIAGLRHEFEKAWKLVEISQDREARSKEVIENLKNEMVTLTRLVEQGGTLAYSQENSLQDVSDQIVQLKKEISIQSTQLHEMMTDLDRSKAESEQCIEDTKRLAEEYVTLGEQIQEEKDSNQNITESLDEIHQQLQDTKIQIKQGQQQYDDNVILISQKRDSNLDLEAELKEQQRTLRAAQEDKKSNDQQAKLTKQRLDHKIKQNLKVEEEISNFSGKFAENDETIALMKKELQETIAQIASSTATQAHYQEKRAELTKTRSELKTKIHDDIQHLYVLRSELVQKEGDVDILRREIERKRKDVQTVESKVASETSETAFTEDQSNILVSEALAMKSRAHNNRGELVKIQQEIEAYKEKTSDRRSDILQLTEEAKTKSNELDEVNIILSDIYEHLKHQDSVNETVQSERDLKCRLLESAAADNASVQKENLALVMEIRQLKEDIREKDQACVEAHFKQKKLQNLLVRLAKQKEIAEEKLRETDSECTEYRNRIQRARHLLSQAELEMLKQKQVTSNNQSIEGFVIKKTQEITLLHEKIAVLTGLLSMGAEAYKKQEEEYNKCYNELQATVEKNRELKIKTAHTRALRLEEIRIMKSLLLMQGKCRALEDELERPINIHRWRFLEGTNPEMAQLLRMTRELKDRLLIQIAIITRLRNKLNKISDKANVQEKHMKNAYPGRIEDEMQYLEDTLREKIKQLSTIQSIVYTQQGDVDTSAGKVLQLRQMLRDQKTEYYETKKKADEIRCSTAISGTKRTTDITKLIESKFIGGGFAVGGIKQDPRIPKDGTRSAPRSPHIVQPRAKSEIRHKVPQGWSPQRQPINPFLPTASASTSK